MNVELQNFIQQNRILEWKPSLDIPNNLWDSNWPWAPIFSENYDYTSTMLEMDEIDYLFVPHRDKDKIKSYGHEGWYSVTLHGISYDKTEHFDRYGFSSQEEAGYNWTDICSMIPKTIELIKSFPFKNYGRIRIMRLSPGGYIMPHVDGPSRVFGPFNFALSNPQGCEFIFENYGLVPFQIGRGFMLDIGNRHCVYNGSNQYRYHVIVHGEPLSNINEFILNSIRQL